MSSLDWDLRNIDELCTKITSGGTPSRSRPEYFSGGTVPWIKTGELNDSYVTDYSERITEEAVAASSAKLLPQGTVLMAMYGATVGALGVLSEPATCNQASCAMISDPNVCDGRWLFYALLSDRQRIVSLATGAAQQNLSAGTIRSFSYRTPSVAEQRAIAEVLGALDDKIAANANMAETSALLAASIYSSIITPGSDVLAIGEMSTLLSRGVSPSYSDDVDAMVVLNQKCIRGQRVGVGPSRLTVSGRVRADKILQLEDILINSTGQGTLGRVARWTLPFAGPVTVDSHITIVRIDSDRANPTCAGHALLGMQAAFEEMAEGSTGQTELSRTELAKMKVALPARESQVALGRRLRTLQELQNAMFAENETLAVTRDALLPQLMSGKLRVRDAEKTLEGVL